MKHILLQILFTLIDQIVHCANHDRNMLILIMTGLPHEVISIVKMTLESGNEASGKIINLS